MKLKLVLLLILLAAVVGAIVVFKPRVPRQTGNKIKVVTSFYPLYYFASQIGGDLVDVVNITPAGAEPHDYEPTTTDISQIEKSNLLILNGGGLEVWGDRVKAPMVVIAGEGEMTNSDPHVWLDPVLAQKEVEKIAAGLIDADPANRSVYEKNSKNLRDRLAVLDQEFRTGLAICKQSDIVTSHAAFGYLAARYGLKQVSISGLSPDEEPSPKQLANVAQFAKMNEVKYIFFETLVSPKLAETIAREVGAGVVVFNPLEGLTDEEQAGGKDYFSVQKENLDSLKIALECK